MLVIVTIQFGLSCNICVTYENKYLMIVAHVKVFLEFVQFYYYPLIILKTINFYIFKRFFNHIFNFVQFVNI